MGNKPDWEKTYKIKNCTVIGFCKLTKLTPDKFNKVQYALSVLVDKKVGETIKKEAEEAIENLKEDYDCNVTKFVRITDILKKDKDDNGKVINKIKCPSGQIRLILNTNSYNGSYLVLVVDGKNKPIKDIILGEGSIVNVNFKLQTFLAKNNSNGGVSLRLQAVQVVKAVANNVKNELTESPFDILDDAEDLEDEYTDEEEFEEDEVPF